MAQVSQPLQLCHHLLATLSSLSLSPGHVQYFRSMVRVQQQDPKMPAMHPSAISRHAALPAAAYLLEGVDLDKGEARLGVWGHCGWGGGRPRGRGWRGVRERGKRVELELRRLTSKRKHSSARNSVPT